VALLPSLIPSGAAPLTKCREPWPGLQKGRDFGREIVQNPVIAQAWPVPEGVAVTYSVLVVDDFEPWRRHVCRELQESSRWRVVGEAGDGREAVRQAQVLEPDLVLLDINLPAMNGLEAARRMLEHRSTVRILFLTEERSPEIADVAFATGARGYAIKSDTGGRLLRATETIANGGRFLSSALAGRIDCRRLDPHRAGCCHDVGFYSDETALLDDYVGLAEPALRQGDTVIVLADPGRYRAVHDRLAARGVPIERAIDEGRYVSIHPDDILSAFMVNGGPDEAAFRAIATDVIALAQRAATSADRRVVLCGECAPALWRRGLIEAAIRVEYLWDEVSRDRGVETLCAYPMDVPRLDADRYALFQRVCGAHAEVQVR
jgi:CheY-like chemotaxis protein